jgi:hypothetical protein
MAGAALLYPHEQEVSEASSASFCMCERADDCLASGRSGCDGKRMCCYDELACRDLISIPKVEGRDFVLQFDHVAPLAETAEGSGLALQKASADLIWYLCLRVLTRCIVLLCGWHVVCAEWSHEQYAIFTISEYA